MLLATPECYGITQCDGSAASVSDLFNRYEEAGFLYPEKRALLAPYFNVIRDNWQRLLSSPDALVKTYTYSRGKTWGSASYFLHCDGGWCGHHLVSMGHPVASRAVTLAAALDIVQNRTGASYHTWFRPTTRLTNKVSGARMLQRLGPRGCEVRPFHYLLIPKERLLSADAAPDRFKLTEAESDTDSELYEFVKHVRGDVYAQSQGLAGDDIRLRWVNVLYQRIGLYRYRRIWTVRRKDGDMPVAVVMAHRGPLGMNFSFLENSLDLICSDELAAEAGAPLVMALLARAGQNAYADFSPPFLVVTADRVSVSHLQRLCIGAGRCYDRMALLSSRWRDYCEHVDRVYESLDRIVQRGAT